MSLKNWKAQRNERIAAAKARKSGKVTMDTSKVDPRSKEFLEKMELILMGRRGAIQSKEVMAQCCYDITGVLKSSFNEHVLSRGPQQDRFLAAMAGALAKAGITEEWVQEDIIIQILQELKRIGGA